MPPHPSQQRLPEVYYNFLETINFQPARFKEETVAFLEEPLLQSQTTTGCVLNQG
jgi:hypothetical protein